MRHEELQEDQDSLFGSPPSSPRLSTGRPASPALALPSARDYGNSISGGRTSISTTHAATQNVGTIALPGSQPDSELPINPLALSLNLGIVHRPPALLSPATSSSSSSFASASGSTTVNQASKVAGRSASSGSTGALHSSSATQASSYSARSTSKSIRKRAIPSPRAASDEPRSPEFPLPDPSAPPPSHFLRNQENLLGKAGLVAGVRPSTLVHSRGSTPANPIVVEEEDDTPKIGRRSRGGFAQPYIDPSLLTAPSNQEIVSTLIGQKDIFPILEGVLKLVVGNAAATVNPRPAASESGAPSRQSESRQQSPAKRNTSSEFPALKRRKLNRVPAGAADWDVPYPFKEGEGPEAYEKTWERERGKQLISQLIQQIKIAARKAATKKYLQEQKEKQMAEERRRSSAVYTNTERNSETIQYMPPTPTDAYSLEENRKVYDVLQDASNVSLVSESTTPIQSTMTPQPGRRPSSAPSNDEVQRLITPTFEQLTSSYIASMQSTAMKVSEQPAALALPDAPTTNSTFPSTSSVDPWTSTISSSSPIDFDQPSFDSWMNLFLQSMPPSSFDFTSGQLEELSSTSTSAQVSHCSTPGPTQLGDLMPEILPLATADDRRPVFNSTLITQAPVSCDHGSDALSNPHLSLNDLDLNFVGMDTTSSVSATEVASPIPSTSSFAETCNGSVNSPATPLSAVWDVSFPDVNANSSTAHRGIGGDASVPGWNAGILIDGSIQSFGFFPELEVMRKEADLTNVGCAVDGREIEKRQDQAICPLPEAIAPDIQSQEKAFRALIDTRIPGLTDAPIPVPKPTTTASQTSTSAAYLPFITSSSTRTSDPGTTPVPSTAKELRKKRKDSIIRRAKAKRQRIREELDEVKKQLWSTTVEQAGLLLLLRNAEEDEPRKVRSSERPVQSPKSVLAMDSAGLEVREFIIDGE